MNRNQILIKLSNIIAEISEVRAMLEAERMTDDAESLYTIENDLIWQYGNILEFSEQ